MNRRNRIRFISGQWDQDNYAWFMKGVVGADFYLGWAGSKAL
jgi:hypothetical protein